MHMLKKGMHNLPTGETGLGLVGRGVVGQGVTKIEIIYKRRHREKQS